MGARGRRWIGRGGGGAGRASGVRRPPPRPRRGGGGGGGGAGGGGGVAAFGDLLPSDAPAPEEEVTVSLRESAVRHALASLPERERTVVELRYGLGGGEGAAGGE